MNINGRMICKRLHRGEDLLIAIKNLAASEKLDAAVVLSAVGCVSKFRVRDASGVTIQELDEDCEILSMNGTVSQTRTHLHIACSKKDLSTIGGHLVEGCIINTTCELILAELPNIRFGVEQDKTTGYDEIIFQTK